MNRQSDHPCARREDDPRSPSRFGERPRRSALARALAPSPRLLCTVGLVLSLPLNEACQTPETALTSPSSASGAGGDPPRTSQGQEQPKQARTANPDGRTFDNQPDYDAEAAGLREFVAPLLPSPPPSDPQAACKDMYAAVDRFYSAIETAPHRRQELQRNLIASRDDDLRSCVAETTPTAAACVAVLLGRRTAELPWLLDQCSRAYP